MDVTTLLGQVAEIKAIVATIPAPTPPVDLQPVSDALTDLKADVSAKAPATV